MTIPIYSASPNRDGMVILRAARKDWIALRRRLGNETASSTIQAELTRFPSQPAVSIAFPVSVARMLVAVASQN